MHGSTMGRKKEKKNQISFLDLCVLTVRDCRAEWGVVVGCVWRTGLLALERTVVHCNCLIMM